MRQRILLLGGSGQIGRGLAQLLPALGEVIALGRQQLDLAKPQEMRLAVRSLRPGLIVNAAAYTAVDRAESEEATAQAVNAEAPRAMAEEAARIGAPLVHYSTDYIFDGSKGAPYLEDDPPDPQNVYGRTKLAGEQAIRQSGVSHLIFRTAWVYDREGRNFLRTILRLATQREELRIVADQIGAPAWSREIAQASVHVLRQMCARGNLTESFAELGGTYHMTAAGQTSWYGFAMAILEEASHHPPSGAWFAAATDGRPLIAQRVTPISTEQYPTPARRPVYSILSSARLSRAFAVQLADWRTQLHSMFSDEATQRTATG
jgi:dTDP-4-dehydrorhamnose reductase